MLSTGIITSAQFEGAEGINDSCAAPLCCPLLWELEVSVLLTPICTTELTLAALAQSTGFGIFPFNSHQFFFSSETFPNPATEWQQDSKCFQNATFLKTQIAFR